MGLQMDHAHTIHTHAKQIFFCFKDDEGQKKKKKKIDSQRKTPKDDKALSLAEKIKIQVYPGTREKSQRD